MAVGYLSGKRLGRGMGFWMVGGELGRTLGPLVVVSALAVVSLRSMAFLSLAGVATSVILHFRLRDVPLRSRGDGEQTQWKVAITAMRSLMILLGSMVVLRSLMMMANGTFLSMNVAIRSVAAIALGAFGDAFGLSTAMLIAAMAMFGGLPLIWMIPTPRGK